MRHAAMLGLLFAASMSTLCAAAPVPPAAPEAEVKHVIKTLPGITVDTGAKEVRLEGLVCLQKGALELLVCSEGSREHESVVVVKAKPSHVTFALALLGLQPGRPGFITEGGAYSPPAGAVVEITARFTMTEGTRSKTVEVPAWKLLRPSGAEAGLERPLQWVYVGQSGDEALKDSDREGTVVCLSNFTEAVLDVPFESSSVNADLLYEANPDVVPPLRTPVELILRPTGQRVEPKKVECEVVLRKGRPPLLDSREVALAALKDAVNAMPVDVRTAVLRAEAQEAFGRVMEVHDILRDALMQVRLMVLQPAPVQAKPPGPPLAVAVEADDRVRVADKTYSLEVFGSKAATILAGVERASITAGKAVSFKTVAEVMVIIRGQGVAATLVRSEAAPSKP
ncbi:MAG: hypothetical protein FJ288_00180 [Planctomycetes bacterium]|nr:hypothetical protein [Planctomycetota bacterium]